VAPTVILDTIANFYNFEKVLGNGHFGVVREATRINSDSQYKYAIKSISKEVVKGNE
jgi:serine/threonine protein kinase